MEDNQRKRILQNIEALVRDTDFRILCEACLEYNLLTPVMVSNIYQAEPQKSSSEHGNEDSIKTDRHKRLFIKITKRGPKAFEKLIQILHNLNYKAALRTLNGDDDRFLSISQSKNSGQPTMSKDDNGNTANNNIDVTDELNGQVSSYLNCWYIFKFKLTILLLKRYVYICLKF